MCGAAFLWYFISAIELAQAPGWMKNTFVIYAVHQIMGLINENKIKYNINQNTGLYLLQNTAFMNSCNENGTAVSNNCPKYGIRRATKCKI